MVFSIVFFDQKLTLDRWILRGIFPKLGNEEFDRIIHGTKVYSYLHLDDFSKVNVGKYTIHGSYGPMGIEQHPNSCYDFCVACIYGEPSNNPFTMTFSPLTLCRTIVISPTKNVQ